MNKQPKDREIKPTTPLWPLDLAREAWTYGLDAAQRSILFLDVLRQRGERFAPEP